MLCNHPYYGMLHNDCTRVVEYNWSWFDTHSEAKMKCMSSQNTSLPQRLNTQTLWLLNSRRTALLKQLSALKYLLRQGLAIRGHKELEGNLNQLLAVWANDCCELGDWLREGKFLSHDIINEQIALMGQSILRKVLSNINANSPSWYAIIAEEATDVANREQMNLSVRWVSDEYCVSEDPVGLFSLPDTTADTIVKVLKDLLTLCVLPVSLCRGQAYDGAADMQGKHKGVATQIRHENPAAIPVHCFAHCLNLCLQDAGRQISLLRDALDVVREISCLIRFSPKRSHLFSEKLSQSECSGVNIKPLCSTRWTARTSAIEAVLKDYSTLMETMEEIHCTTHDENGLKARGVLSALGQFDTLFGLNLAYTVFGAAEETSKCLQAKDTSLQEGLSSISLTAAFYRRQRMEGAFDLFYDRMVKTAEALHIGQPQLPRYRRPPLTIDAGSQAHRFLSPRDYYRQLYYQACDLLLRELEDRFNQNDNLAPVLALESLILKAANGESYDDVLHILEESCYANDLDFVHLKRQLPLLVDVIKQLKPVILKVTTVRTVCEAMSTNNTYKLMLSEVHKLLRLYLTVPVTSSTSERTFSAMKRLLTYLRSTMTEKRLNNCLLLHVHKDLTDQLNLFEIANEFISLNPQRKIFWFLFHVICTCDCACVATYAALFVFV